MHWLNPTKPKSSRHCGSSPLWESWESAHVCSTQPEKPEIPPFCTDVSTLLLSVINFVSLLARTEKKILPSVFSSDIVLNCVMSFASFSFGVTIPSATCQHDGIFPFLQTTLDRVHNLRSSSGHILYTLYGNTFGPVAGPDLALFTICFTAFHVGYVVSISISGALTDSMRGHSPKGLSLCLSLCVCWRCDSMSSMLQSGLPDFSPFSSDLVNLNGLAVNEALVFALAFLFFLRFSAFL